MTSKTNYLGGLRTEATHIQSNNTIITDAPVDNHGKGEAFSPTDLLATSLASCMLTVMGIKAEASGIDMIGATAEVTKFMVQEPRRVGEIVVKIKFAREYSDKEKQILEHTALTCPVGKSLHPDLRQTISFEYKS